MPQNVFWIWYSGAIVINTNSWTWFGAINEAKKIIANKQGVKLKFPGDIVASGKFERDLGSNVDSNECGMAFIGVMN